MNDRMQDTQDEAEVRAALERFHAAVSAIFIGDAGPMQEVWSHADDVTYMGPDGAYRKGWPEVLADWEAQAALGLGGDVAPVDVCLVVGSDLALAHNVVRGANRDADGNPVAVSLRATVMFRREAGAWMVVGVHTDPLPGLLA